MGENGQRKPEEGHIQEGPEIGNFTVANIEVGDSNKFKPQKNEQRNGKAQSKTPFLY